MVFILSLVCDLDYAGGIGIGSKGYFADRLMDLKRKVEQENPRDFMKVVDKDHTRGSSHWVKSDSGLWWKYFYLVKEY